MKKFHDESHYNQYVIQPFWDYQNGRTTEEHWQLACPLVVF